MLGKVKFHGILENQRNIFTHLCRISQVLIIQFGSFISDVIETHGCLNNLGIVGNDVLDWVLENEVLVFFGQIFNDLSDKLRTFLVPAVLTMILEGFLTEGVTLLAIEGSLESLFDARLFKNAVTINMHPSLTLAAIDHVLIQVVLQLGGSWQI
jgi:hypothetical protein